MRVLLHKRAVTFTILHYPDVSKIGIKQKQQKRLFDTAEQLKKRLIQHTP